MYTHVTYTTFLLRNCGSTRCYDSGIEAKGVGVKKFCTMHVCTVYVKPVIERVVVKRRWRRLREHLRVVKLRSRKTVDSVRDNDVSSFMNHEHVVALDDAEKVTLMGLM